MIWSWVAKTPVIGFCGIKKRKRLTYGFSSKTLSKVSGELSKLQICATKPCSFAKWVIKSNLIECGLADFRSSAQSARTSVFVIRRGGSSFTERIGNVSSGVGYC